eukprot:TRINITY_DN66487_c0_g1_i1.p1 TRINITY_DN66487_c0_g1~~TRINITY_DN66487_c0_g1_i1.p1  ORF type:complete len:865 (+),score=72.32 TRINITY_DN66487_c0_g1_i1:255-2597(+)
MEDCEACDQSSDCEDMDPCTYNKCIKGKCYYPPKGDDCGKLNAHQESSIRGVFTRYYTASFDPAAQRLYVISKGNFHLPDAIELQRSCRNNIGNSCLEKIRRYPEGFLALWAALENPAPPVSEYLRPGLFDMRTNGPSGNADGNFQQQGNGYQIYRQSGGGYPIKKTALSPDSERVRVEMPAPGWMAQNHAEFNELHNHDQGDFLDIYDFSDPSAPRLLQRMTPEYGCRWTDVAVAGDKILASQKQISCWQQSRTNVQFDPEGEGDRLCDDYDGKIYVLDGRGDECSVVEEISVIPNPEQITVAPDMNTVAVTSRTPDIKFIRTDYDDAVGNIDDAWEEAYFMCEKMGMYMCTSAQICLSGNSASGDFFSWTSGDGLVNCQGDNNVGPSLSPTVACCGSSNGGGGISTFKLQTNPRGPHTSRTVHTLFFQNELDVNPSDMNVGSPLLRAPAQRGPWVNRDDAPITGFGLGKAHTQATVEEPGPWVPPLRRNEDNEVFWDPTDLDFTPDSKYVFVNTGVQNTLLVFSVEGPLGATQYTNYLALGYAPAPDGDWVHDGKRKIESANGNVIFAPNTITMLGYSGSTYRFATANTGVYWEYASGMRSVSVWETDLPAPGEPSTPGLSASILSDTGGLLEAKIAQYLPNAFNAAWKFDDASSTTGPAPSVITTGMVFGVPYVFVSCQGGHVVAVLKSLPDGELEFVQFLENVGVTKDGAIIGGDVGPESLEFVSAEASPTKCPLLMISYTGQPFRPGSGNVVTWQLELEGISCQEAYESQGVLAQ